MRGLAPPVTDQQSFKGPSLHIGLIGVSPGQRRKLKHSLERCSTGSVEWHLATIGDADAWFINGERVQLLDDGSIRVPGGSPGERSTRLSLDDVDRPVVFVQPIACKELEPALRFSLANDRTLRSALKQLESRWLSNTAAQLWLADRLISEDDHYTRVLHVVHNGRLLAVVDKLGDVGILPGALLEELELAEWQPRPPAAHFLPPHFHSTSFSKLIWQYAVRPNRELLPRRYRDMRIHFRRPPRIPQQLLRDEHLVVIQALAAGPLDFEALQARCCIDEETLARALAALYLTGSITTDPRRSGVQSLFRAKVGTSGAERALSHRKVADGFPAYHDLTVPAHLVAEPQL